MKKNIGQAREPQGSWSKWLCLCLLTLSFFGYSVNSVADVSGRCPSTNDLALDSSLNGAIDHEGDKDVYRITAPSDGVLTVFTTGSTNTFGSLRDANCVNLQSNNNGSDGKNFSIRREVTAGTYYIIVRHRRPTRTGDYVLLNTFTASTASVDSVGNTCSEATSLSVNTSIDSSIDNAGDYDYFRIDLSARSNLKVQTIGSTDTYGYLMDSNCNTIASDDDNGTDANFLIEKLVDAGTYYVAVRDYFGSATAENYTVSNTATAAIQPADVQVITGKINTQCAAQYYDSFQVHSVEPIIQETCTIFGCIKYTVGYKTKMKKLDNCLRVDTFGPLNVVARSAVDQAQSSFISQFKSCTDDAVNSTIRIGVPAAVLAVVADIFGAGGSATSAVVSWMLERISTKIEICVENAPDYLENAGKSVLDSFSSSVYWDRQWVYWYL